MITLGAACLILALLTALVAGCLALIGTRGDRRYVDASRLDDWAGAFAIRELSDVSRAEAIERASEELLDAVPVPA